MSLLSTIRTLDELDLENQVVFVRADLDCPLNKSGEITEDHRIATVVPTIEKLREMGARVVVGSRFGDAARPLDRSRNDRAPSIEPAAARLGALLGCDVLLPDSCTGESVKKVLQELRTSQICVLENLASEDDFGPQAESFARRLEPYFDAYVADSVRALADESATAAYLPKLMEFRAASPNVMRELQAVVRIRSGVDRPRLVVWGGNNLSGRLDLLRRLAGEDAQVALVGVAANTMLRALGSALGRSAVEEDYLAGARTLSEQLGRRLVLPIDLLAAPSPRAESGVVRAASRIPEGEMALDLGPESIKQLSDLIARSGTTIWCGTVGFHKSESFAVGTKMLGEALAQSEGFTLVVGDDSVSAAQTTCTDSLAAIDCVAQGGAATLALLNETKLPGLEALRGTIPNDQTHPPDRR